MQLTYKIYEPIKDIARALLPSHRDHVLSEQRDTWNNQYSCFKTSLIYVNKIEQKEYRFNYSK